MLVVGASATSALLANILTKFISDINGPYKLLQLARTVTATARPAFAVALLSN